MKSKVLFWESDRIPADRFSAFIDELDLADQLRAARTVVIKPNLCAGTHYTSESAVVTQRRVLEDLIVSVSRLAPDAIIYIAESDSTGKGYAWRKFEVQGYLELAEKYPNVQLLDLSRDRLRIIQLDGGFFEDLELSEILLDADFYINLAKMKTHNITTITGVLKNQFGILPYFDKSSLHPHLNAVLTDLMSAARPHLCIVEGAPPMEGDGPVNGVPRDMKLILVGNDPVAVDAVAAEVMGFSPCRIAHIARAARSGLGECRISHIEMDREALNRSRCKFRFVSPLQRCMMALGLGVQRFGALIAAVGHEIHFLASPFQAWRPIARFMYSIGKRSRIPAVRRMVSSMRKNYKNWKSQSRND